MILNSFHFISFQWLNPYCVFFLNLSASKQNKQRSLRKDIFTYNSSRDTFILRQDGGSSINDAVLRPANFFHKRPGPGLDQPGSQHRGEYRSRGTRADRSRPDYVPVQRLKLQTSCWMRQHFFSHSRRLTLDSLQLKCYFGLSSCLYQL